MAATIVLNSAVASSNLKRMKRGTPSPEFPFCLLRHFDWLQHDAGSGNTIWGCPQGGKWFDNA
jgi:hypothetical protein